MIFQGNLIGSWVSLRVGITVLSFIVEGLVHVTNVMNQETKSKRLGQFWLTGVQSVLNVVINITLLVIITIIRLTKPLNQSWRAVGIVVFLDILLKLAFLIRRSPQFSFKVEIWLPGMTVVLDIICKSGALYEGVVNLTVSEFRIFFFQIG